MSSIKTITPHFFFPGCAKNFLLVRVETDDGYYGWGEGYVGAGKEKVTEEFLKAFADYLVGREVFDIRHMSRALFDDFINRRSAIDFYSAWSAVEIALYDIMGKMAGQPVYNLIGGRCRDKIRVYANGWWAGITELDKLVERAVEVKKMGFTALKWDPFFGPWRTDITKKDEDAAVENVKAMREALGPDMELLVEVHRRLSPYHAVHFADRIAEYHPFWFEEPCCSDNIDLIAEVRSKTRQRIVSGETLYTREEFRELFEKRAVDIINPDICLCNGIHGIMDIASMAEPYAVAYSPHSFNSGTVALAAMLHTAAAAPNFLIAELFINVKPGSDGILVKPFEVKNGFIDLPTEPGLGIDIKMDELAKHPLKVMRKEFPYRGIMDACGESPKPSDFADYR